MHYQVLARKYRPLRFADVAGQDHVTRTLQNAITQGRIAHGYIFSGHRGIGKTTIARILASALNCQNGIGSEKRPSAEPCLQCDSCMEIRQGNSVDVLEIDAATNRGIDEIRELRDAARYRPARDTYKIYILDEAHQITDAAFNALLKTLEEPPDHIIFMMATTEPENIPQTIRSRCQHFSFHAVKFDDILAQLSGIAQAENVDANDTALALLAEAGDGSMRDALSIMDQAIASAPVTDGNPVLDAGQIRSLMGSVSNTVFEQILEAVSDNNAADVLTIASTLLDAGNSPQQIARQMVRYLRNAVVAKVANLTPDNAASDLLQISPEERKRAARTAMLFTEEDLTRFLQMMLRTFDDLGFRQEQRFHLELGLLKLVHVQRLIPMEELLSALPSGSSSTPRTTPTLRATTSSTFGSASVPVSSPAPGSSSAPPHEQPRTPSQAVPARPITQAEASEPKVSSAPPTQDKVQAPSAPPPSPIVSPFASTPLTAPLEPGGKETAKPQSIATSSSGVTAPVMENKAPASVSAQPQTFGSLAIAEPVVNVAAPAPLDDADETGADDEATGVDITAGSESDQLRTAVVEALFAAKNQTNAAEKLDDAEWSIANGEIRIQTDLSTAMLKMVIRPETDAIIKATLRGKDVSLRVVILPVDKTKAPTEKKARAPRAGSVQSAAMEHPLVQQAQKLFQAEITSVRDLRK